MKIGLDQIGKPAPELYVKIVNGLIVIVIPATATFISAIPEDMISMNTKLFLGLTVTYVTAILKAFQSILGTTKPTEDGPLTT